MRPSGKQRGQFLSGFMRSFKGVVGLSEESVRRKRGQEHTGVAGARRGCGLEEEGTERARIRENVEAESPGYAREREQLRAMREGGRV